MARPDTAVTAALGLPLRVTGMVQLQNSVKRGFQLIEDAIVALQGGSGLNASEIAYDPSGDSNSTATTVAGALDDIYSEIAALRAAVNSSNSGDIPAL